MKLIVTFDGPVACGKSSLARRVARRVDYIFLSTGLLYRAVALKVVHMGFGSLIDDETAMVKVVVCQSYMFKVVDGESRLLLDGIDSTDRLKNDELSMIASRISKHQKLRRALLQIQQDMGNNGGVVAEGRDVGRVVFPNAHLKYWLTADVRFRAKMRQRDLRDAGKNVSFREVYRQVQERDKQDMEGESPSLIRTSDMRELDTTNKQLDDLADVVVDDIREIEGNDGMDKK